MRLTAAVVVMTSTLLVAYVHAGPSGQDTVVMVLAKARDALGGEDRLSAIHSFVIRGAIVSGTGYTKEYGSFEISCELPDKFVLNRDLGRASDPSTHETSRLGFNGDHGIVEGNSPSLGIFSGSRYQSMPLQMLLSAAREQFSDVTLGLFAASFDGAPVVFEPAPDGAPANAVLVRGTDEFVMTFDPISHLPMSLGDLIYSDYRKINGIRVPWKIQYTRDERRLLPPRHEKSLSSRPVVYEEWDLRAFQTNVQINPNTFK
jgi:hypothetical protein